MSEVVATLEHPDQFHPEVAQGEWLRQRTEQALDDCDFVRTPELEQSIEGFYASHYQLTSVMRLGLQESSKQHISDEDQRAYLNSIIDDSYFDRTEIERVYTARLQGYGVNQPYVQQVTPLLARVRLARLDDSRDSGLRRVELSALAEAGEALFAEASVGVTTLTGREADLILSLRKTVAEQIKESGLFPHLQDKSEEELIGDSFQPVNEAIDTFRRDSRFAGQLLFHNTGHFGTSAAGAKSCPAACRKGDTEPLTPRRPRSWMAISMRRRPTGAKVLTRTIIGEDAFIAMVVLWQFLLQK